MVTPLASTTPQMRARARVYQFIIFFTAACLLVIGEKVTPMCQDGTDCIDLEEILFREASEHEEDAGISLLQLTSARVVSASTQNHSSAQVTTLAAENNRSSEEAARAVSGSTHNESSAQVATLAAESEAKRSSREDAKPQWVPQEGIMLGKLQQGKQRMQIACQRNIETRCQSYRQIFDALIGGSPRAKNENEYTAQVINMAGLGSWVYVKGGMHAVVRATDADRSGDLSWLEMRAQIFPGADLQMGEAMFRAADANGDGVATVDEIRDFARNVIAVRDYVPEIDPYHMGAKQEGTAFPTRNGLERLLPRSADTRFMSFEAISVFFTIAILAGLCWNSLREPDLYKKLAKSLEDGPIRDQLRAAR